MSKKMKSPMVTHTTQQTLIRNCTGDDVVGMPEKTW